jgi:formylglycine-generating enzyme required for sulfatase activity
MSHIFISYSKKNKDYARAFADHLEANGFDVWIDDEIDYGDSWERKMFKAIDDCVAFVVIMTPEAYESDWVLRECEYASRRNKPQFPVLRDGEEFPRYMTHQWLDVRDGRMPPEDFFVRLAKSITRKSTQSENSTNMKVQQPPAPPTFNLALLEWCEIPAGNVTIEGVACDVSTFWMAKYPVTYAQYEQFIQDDGYGRREYWTDAGRTWLGNLAATSMVAPGFWNLSKWHINNHPVNGVSWYEAYAFTRWLSVKLHSTIKLPTESQWQRAAQGDDRRIFPWGNEFNNSKINTGESEIGKTTPVSQYPDSASPFSVMDMSGNVWEWCLSRGANPYHFPEDNAIEGENVRVIRGGSFFNLQHDARVTYRNVYSPGNRNSYLGFRVVCVNTPAL